MERIAENLYIVRGSGYSSNSYIVTGSKSYAIIDAGLPEYSEKIIRAIRSLGLESYPGYLILTHMHYDHIGGAENLKKMLNVQVMIHEYEREYIEKGDPLNTVALFFNISNLRPIKCDHALHDKEVLRLDGLELKIIHTPGHTIGSITIHIPSNKALLTGDTIFENGAYGRTDLPTGDIKLLIRSLEKLSKIDAELLCPGHGDVFRGNVRQLIDLAIKYAKEEI